MCKVRRMVINCWQSCSGSEKGHTQKQMSLCEKKRHQSATETKRTSPATNGEQLTRITVNRPS